MDLFSYLLGKKAGGGGTTPIDTTDIRNVINMTGVNITSETPFTDYPQDLYDGYISIIKSNATLYNNLNRGNSTGTLTDGADLPLYEMKLSKESTQSGTPTPQNPVPINVVGGGSYNLFDKDHLNVLGNGEYYVAGNGTISQGYNNNFIWVQLKPSTTYTFTQTKKGESGIRFGVYANVPTANMTTDFVSPTWSASDTSVTWTFTTTDTQYYLGYSYYNSEYPSSYTKQEILGSIMIVEGNEVLPYKPFGEYEFDITISDGTNSKTVSINLGSYEIVGKGNNLDELIIDKDGKVTLKKVFDKIDSYNGETITTDYISTTGGLDTGATIYYVKSSPSIIDLNQTVDLTLYEGSNTISNTPLMDENITYIKNTYE